jgi:outer membrane protein
MKTSLKTLLTAFALGISAVIAHAQPAPKIAVVDLAKVFDNHYETQEQQEKLKGVQAKVEEELARMVKDGTALADKFKELSEQAKNPVLTADARKAAEADALKQLELVRKAEQDYGQYRNDAGRDMQQSIGSFQQLMLEKISKVATEIAKKKGATFLVGKNAIIYADPAYDITEEVMAEINKSRPAGSPAASTPAAPATGEAPGVSFPGTKK